MSCVGRTLGGCPSWASAWFYCVLCMVIPRAVHGSTVPCRNSLGTKMRFSSAIYHHWRYKTEKRTAVSGKSIMTTLVTLLTQIGNVWKVRMISATNRLYEPNHHCFRGCAPVLFVLSAIKAPRPKKEPGRKLLSRPDSRRSDYCSICRQVLLTDKFYLPTDSACRWVQRARTSWNVPV